MVSFIGLATKDCPSSAVSPLCLPSVGEVHSCLYQAQKKAKVQKFWTAVQSLSPFRWVSLCSCRGPGALHCPIQGTVSRLTLRARLESAQLPGHTWEPCLGPAGLLGQHGCKEREHVKEQMNECELLSQRPLLTLIALSWAWEGPDTLST